jgi:hypothetical protein
MINRITMPAIKAVPMMPPATPPTISATFEPPVELDWLLLVEIAMGAVPVTSGESARRPSIRKKLRVHF